MAALIHAVTEMHRHSIIFILLTFLSAMIGPARPVMAGDLDGDYVADGADADGHAYSGVVRIQSLGGAEAVLWKLDNAGAYKGLGLTVDGVLGVAYGPATAQFGVVVYKINGGTLDGQWTLPKYASGPAGREVLEGSPALDGEYKITLGENPDGTTNYAGKVRLQRQGDVYAFAWFTPGPNPSAVGIGVRQGDVIAVAYGGSIDHLGVVAYRINGDLLEGVWSGGKTRLGRETLSRKP